MRDMIVWCKGRRFQELVEYGLLPKERIKFIVEGNVDKQGDWRGIEVVAPQKLREMDCSQEVILIATERDSVISEVRIWLKENSVFAETLTLDEYVYAALKEKENQKNISGFAGKMIKDCLKDKEIYLFPKGKIQMDFEYIFDDIEIEGYADKDKDCLIEESSREIIVPGSSCLIICEEFSKDRENELACYGFAAGKNLLWVWDFLPELDYCLQSAVKGRKVVLCSDTPVDDFTCKVFEVNERIATEKLDECNPSDVFCIIHGYSYDKVPMLEKNGFKSLEDFVDLNRLRFLTRCKVSSYLERTMKAPAVEQPDCSEPFVQMQTNSNGRLFGCCPGWPEYEFGSFKTEDPDSVWNSIYAKVFRLSIINRTFVFCKKTNCPKLKQQDVILEDQTERYNHETLEVPRWIYPALDHSCNLYCSSCRNERMVTAGRDLLEGEYYVDRLISSGWFREDSRLQLSAAGEVFSGTVNQRLLWGLPVKCDVWIVSNGVLFTKQKFELLSEKYNKISVNISIDAASASVYEVVRRGGDWDALVSNLKYLGEKRVDGRISEFYINFTVQRENYRDLPEFVRLAKEIHADAAIIKPIYNWGTYTAEEYKEIAMFDAANGTISEELREVLLSPIMSEPIVSLKWFKERL